MFHNNPYYIIAEASACRQFNTVFHNATLDYWRKKYDFCGKKKLTRYYSSLELWKTEYGLNFLTKMKRWRNFTYDSWLSTEKIVRYAVYFIVHMI